MSRQVKKAYWSYSEVQYLPVVEKSFFFFKWKEHPQKYKYSKDSIYQAMNDFVANKNAEVISVEDTMEIVHYEDHPPVRRGGLTLIYSVESQQVFRQGYLPS